MKLRIYFKPWLVVLLLGAGATALWAIALLLVGWPRLVLLPFALFYTLLFVLAGWTWWRASCLEVWRDWSAAERLLILAPHEDDCVISAGAIGAHNQRLGGVTRIVYLAPDEMPGMAERRAAESRTAWQIAGLGPDDLLHLDLLPRLRQRDPRKLRTAAVRLRSLIDEFKPSVIVVPMFEGGHVHHDQIAALIGLVVSPRDRLSIFEAPEYGPRVSLRYTPHRVLALLARWLFVVVYHGPADGIDGRPIYKFRVNPDDLDRKRRMLEAFVSQNGAWLAATRAYPDRLAEWRPDVGRRQPFALRGSYLQLALAARRILPAKLAALVLPFDGGTVGREGRITDWQEEWSLEKAG